MKDFLKQTGLDRQGNREQVLGFSRSQAQKSRYAAERHYQNWIKDIGADSAPKTLAKYYEEKYNNSPAYRMLKKYSQDVESGWVSPLFGLENYQEQYKRIENEIVGSTTSNGIKITKQSDHFIQRIIGTTIDPQKLKDDLRIIRRSGVSIDDIMDTLKHGKPRRPIVRTGKDGKPIRSQKFVGDKCDVSINPDTGMCRAQKTAWDCSKNSVRCKET